VSQWPIYRWFTYWKWWFSMAMLVITRVTRWYIPTEFPIFPREIPAVFGAAFGETAIWAEALMEHPQLQSNSRTSRSRRQPGRCPNPPFFCKKKLKLMIIIPSLFVHMYLYLSLSLYLYLSLYIYISISICISIYIYLLYIHVFSFKSQCFLANICTHKHVHMDKLPRTIHNVAVRSL
jgi:hypothetical protein